MRQLRISFLWGLAAFFFCLLAAYQTESQERSVEREENTRAEMLQIESETIGVTKEKVS